MNTTQPCEDFLAWHAAAKAKEPTAPTLRAQLVKRRVRMVSHVRPEYVGPTGVIRSMSAGGFRVRWDQSGTTESCHPDDVVFI